MMQPAQAERLDCRPLLGVIPDSALGIGYLQLCHSFVAPCAIVTPGVLEGQREKRRSSRLLPAFTRFFTPTSPLPRRCAPRPLRVPVVARYAACAAREEEETQRPLMAGRHGCHHQGHP